jgi:hypothetical protein
MPLGVALADNFGASTFESMGEITVSVINNRVPRPNGPFC